MERDAFDPFAQKGDDQQSWDPKALGAVDWAAAKAKTGGWDASFDLHEQDGRGVSALNTTVDSSIFEFGADEGASNFSEVALFADDFFAVEDQQRESPGSSVQVAIHEQLTSLQDDGVLAPISQIEGSVHIRSSNNAPFCLVIRDATDVIADLTPDPRLCKDITPGKTNGFIDTGITVLRVTPPLEAPNQLKILSYKCNHKLRPIPLLVKTKVQIAKKDCRVGIKIRSNPENQHSLTQLAIIIAIPPDVNGGSVRLSRKGGVWDSMKRILAWSVDQLDPGELIEIQAQFGFEGGESADRSPKFPVLVRCDAQKEQFSNIELSSNFADQLSSPAKISVVSSVRIMHRKA